MTDATTKVCTVCKNIKGIEEFGKLASSKDGRLCFCKECNRKRNKNYRLSVISVAGKLVTAAISGIDWNNVETRIHEVRKDNDCTVGDYFKNINVTDNFILQINVWDKDENGNRIEVSVHKLYVKADEWKNMISFPESEKMREDLSDVIDSRWSNFVFNYTKVFGLTKPNNLIGLRFKKHGSNGKCVNLGFSTRNLKTLEAKFAK